MSKALNLTDMLWQRNDAAGQERAKEAGASQGAARAARRPRADFLPPHPAPAPAGADKGGTVKSFRERVQESQDRIARKGHTFFKQPGRPDAQEAETAKSGAAKAREAGRDEPADAAAHPRGLSKASARKAVRPDRDDGSDAARTPGKAGAGDCAADAPDAAHGRGAARGREAAESGNAEGAAALRAGSLRPEAEDGEAGGRDEADAMDPEALEARLAELGLEATPEQLRDPAFLAEMLWQIDGIPMGLPLFPEYAPAEAAADPLAVAAAMPLAEAAPEALSAGTAPAPALPGTGSEAASVPGTAPAPASAPAAAGASASAVPGAGTVAPEDALPGTAAAGAAGEDAAPAAETFDWTAVAEPEREEIAALLRDRLAGIAADPALRAAGAETARAAAPGLPDAVQSARAGADRPLLADAPDADPVLADPDRLRVLQNAGLEDALTRETARLALERNLEAEPEAEGGDDARAASEAVPGIASRRTSRDDAQDSPPDLFGRGADARPGAFGAGEAADARKEAPGTPFQSALETVRASEARLAQAKAPVPHAHAPMEASVLAQLARKLSALGPRSAEEIRIQLEPEHLGKVRIAIEMRGEGLTARISVENDAVRQMVDQNLASLKESLESQGVKIQGMEVSVEQRHASLFNPDGSNAREFFRRRGGEPAPAEAAAGEGAEGAAETDTGRRMGYNTMEFIA